MLKGKKILFISPKFFGYELEIKKKMENLGAQVDYFDERPSNSFMVKVLVRLNKKILTKKINNYYSTIAAKTKNINYDYVLFNSPESISKELFLKFKKENNSATFILYMWDSLKNKNAVDLLQFFNKRYSFDQKDCVNQIREIKYRPLFFLDEYKDINVSNNPIEYDLLFIGTLHSDRNKILNQLKNECEKQGLNYFFYLYFPSKALYLIKRIYDKSLWGTKIKDFNFTPLSKKELINFVEKSNVILDIQHPKQNGLTMRTIEMLGAQKKLLTTNIDIVNYDFYQETNIKVIDRNKIKLDKLFFKKEFKKIEEDIYNKYTLNGWLSEIFNNI